MDEDNTLLSQSQHGLGKLDGIVFFPKLISPLSKLYNVEKVLSLECISLKEYCIYFIPSLSGLCMGSFNGLG